MTQTRTRVSMRWLAILGVALALLAAVPSGGAFAQVEDNVVDDTGLGRVYTGTPTADLVQLQDRVTTTLIRQVPRLGGLWTLYSSHYRYVEFYYPRASEQAVTEAVNAATTPAEREQLRLIPIDYSADDLEEAINQATAALEGAGIPISVIGLDLLNGGIRVVVEGDPATPPVLRQESGDPFPGLDAQLAQLLAPISAVHVVAYGPAQSFSVSAPSVAAGEASVITVSGCSAWSQQLADILVTDAAGVEVAGTGPLTSLGANGPLPGTVAFPVTGPPDTYTARIRCTKQDLTPVDAVTVTFTIGGGVAPTSTPSPTPTVPTPSPSGSVTPATSSPTPTPGTPTPTTTGTGNGGLPATGS